MGKKEKSGIVSVDAKIYEDRNKKGKIINETERRCNKRKLC